MTLLDTIDPAPWYTDEYERLANPKRRYERTPKARVTGAFGAFTTRFVRFLPNLWVPSHPTWSAQLRGTGQGRSSRVLDVGCGQGTLLAHLASFGFRYLEGIDPYLVEPSLEIEGNGPAAVRLTRQALDDLEDRFDVIIFNHSLEHVDGPLEMLRQAVKCLSQRGVVLVDLPIIGGASWREFRSTWAGFDAPLHRWIPTPEGMVRLAERSGLELIRWKGETPDYFWARSYEIRRALLDLGAPPDVQAEVDVDEPRMDDVGAQASFVFRQAAHLGGMSASSRN